jgi:hypothetical protein
LVLDAGGLIVAAAQGLVRQLPFLPWEVLRIRGGPLVEGPHGDRGAALQGMLDGIRQEFRGALVRVSPNHLTGDGIEAALQASGFGRPETRRLPETFWVDLEPDLEVLRKRLSSSWRHNLSRAERRGVTVRPVASLEDLRAFFELHAEMIRRKVFRDHLTWNLLRELWRVTSPSGGIQGLLAVSGGAVVAGRIMGVLGREAMDLFAATSPRGREIYASYLLLWEVIKAAKARRCSRFDLGGIDPAGNRGVFEFKQGVRGERVELVGHWNFCRGRALRFLFDTVIEPRL